LQWCLWLTDSGSSQGFGSYLARSTSPSPLPPLPSLPFSPSLSNSSSTSSMWSSAALQRDGTRGGAWYNAGRQCCVRTRGAGVGWTLVGHASAGWTRGKAHLRFCGWGTASYLCVRTRAVRRTSGR
jgi:hypothetical protein